MTRENETKENARNKKKQNLHKKRSAGKKGPCRIRYVNPDGGSVKANLYERLHQNHDGQVLMEDLGEVIVSEICGTQTIIFELLVSKSDVGKVIGNNGRTAASLKTILSAVSAKNKKTVVLEIMD